MVVTITAQRHVTLSPAVLDALGVRPGERLELEEGPEGFLLRPQRIAFANVVPLRDKIERDTRPFDLEEFRSQPHDPALRD